MQVLAWSFIVAWGAVLAVTDWVFATCESDCSDSGVVQGLFLLVLLAPAVAVGVVLLVRGRLSNRDRRALALVGVVDAALVAWLVALFLGVSQRPI